MAPSRAVLRHINTRLLIRTSRPVITQQTVVVPARDHHQTSSISTQTFRPRNNLPPTSTRHYASTESAPSSPPTSSSPSSSAVAAPDYLNEAELKIFETLRDALSPVKLEVQDISGGCGSMYALEISAEQFRGLSVMQQHRMVNKILGEEIKKWHGVQLRTKVP